MSVEPYMCKWRSNTIENFDNFMKELEVGFLLRKAGGMATTYYQLSLNGDTINFKYKIATKKGDLYFKLNEEFDEVTPDGRKVKSTFFMEDGKFKQIQKGKPYDAHVERSITEDGQLLEIAIMAYVSLPINTYRGYFEALRNGDINSVTTFFDQAEVNTYDLINGKFIIPRRKVSFLIERPIHVAVSSGNIDLIKLLCRNGVDITAIGSNDDNTLHIIALISSRNQNNEQMFINVYNYLLQEFDIAILAKLFMSENKQGLRPVELAAKVGAYKVLLRFFETNGVYRKSCKFLGYYQEILYDITDYETTRKTIYYLSLIIKKV
ncbi:DgyrCDS2240 [Dimorphilus gyrociliatus]|uniref:DgyrCDS2240 n=1 Tax=Dimorphilus gyrociliatus TaxID=2664684 RepID=A0A7I8VES7_9ANNE|nr:DgyrCDS2240 [Dimorphilus gyrociliatus]